MHKGIFRPLWAIFGLCGWTWVLTPVVAGFGVVSQGLNAHFRDKSGAEKVEKCVANMDRMWSIVH